MPPCDDKKPSREEAEPSVTAQKFNQNAERHSKDKQFFPSRAGPPAENGSFGRLSKSKGPDQHQIKPYKKTTTMKMMKDFAAQQLSKKQMNEVNGGVLVLECKWQDGRYTIITADQLDEVIASGGNCQPI